MYSGFCDANGQQLIIGDTVLVCGVKGTVTFWCGAYGIQFDDDTSRLLFETSFKTALGHEPHLMHNPTMLTLFEIATNLGTTKTGAFLSVIDHCYK